MSDVDISQRFTIEQTDARGEVVRLSESYQSAFRHIDYPDTLKPLLGEAMAAAVLLSATLKFEGKLSIQLQGKGPVSLLLVQATHDRKLRGLLKWKDEIADPSFRALTAGATLVITIEPDAGKRYQGVVPLEGESLAQCLEYYFLQSEQLPTQVWLTADQTTAAGFLLQKLPKQGEHLAPENWEHISIIAKTITDEELLSLDFETLLYRLFHAEGVRVYDPHPVTFECVCSIKRCENAILSLGSEEIEKMVQQNQAIDMSCEFCGQGFHIGIDRLGELLQESRSPSGQA